MTPPDATAPTGTMSPPVPAPPAHRARFAIVRARVETFLAAHGRKLWWLHSVYALGLGTFVVIFARKGFDHARWLAVSLGAAWLLLVFYFRLHGSGTGQARRISGAPRAHRFRVLAMSYALKNLYQGMLFFLLPFYWNSTTFDSPNRFFVVLLAVCALLSTLDVVFDRFLLRWRHVSTVFYGVTLFACMNLMIPAWLPDTRTRWSLMSAAAVTVLSFWFLHVPLDRLREPRWIVTLIASLGTGIGAAYGLRIAIPPVPMHVSHGAVGPMVLEDGRLAMEVASLHVSVVHQLLAVTDVVVPGGHGDRLEHVWRHEGHELRRSEPVTRSAGPQRTIRLRSSLEGPSLPAPAGLVGHWSVDVETEDGQLVGRVGFNVVE